jgi:hypothetical protein
LHPEHDLGWKGLAPVVLVEQSSTRAGDVLVRLVRVHEEPTCLVVRAEVENRGKTPLRLRSLRWTHASTLEHALRFPADLLPRIFSTEMLRGDYFGPGTCFGNRYFGEVPNATLELGWSEDHVFPGFFLGAATEPAGLFCAAASQERFRPIFRFRGRDTKGGFSFEVDELPVGLDALKIAPGETVRGEHLFFGLCETNDPQRATDAYYAALRREGAFAREECNPLPRQRIWCSWNYDFFANITEADVLRQLPLLTRRLPAVKFVQIDDGYQRTLPGGGREMIDLVYDGGESFDPKKFPSGAKGTADRIRAAGLRPAIWLGLWATNESRMLRENPDWILRDTAGAPLEFHKWYGGVSVLDPSVPGVQAYLDRLCRTVFGEWGYEGVKLDFSSFAFEGKRIAFRHGNRTAVEWKRWLMETFRKYLPKDGFFGWCVVAGTGSPFGGGGADYFRCAMDIGEGNWKLVRDVAAWTANTNMLLQERPVLPNIDSIGWSPHFKPVEFQTWLNLCAVSGTALEVSGDLAKVDVPTLQRFQRTLELSDPARRVRCPDLAEATATRPPSTWLAEGGAGTLLGLFNWGDEPAEVTLPAETAGRATRDAWTCTAVPASRSLRLEPHASALWLLADNNIPRTTH